MERIKESVNDTPSFHSIFYVWIHDRILDPTSTHALVTTYVLIGLENLIAEIYIRR